MTRCWLVRATGLGHFRRLSGPGYGLYLGATWLVDCSATYHACGRRCVCGWGGVGVSGAFLGGWGCLLFNASVLNALPNGLCGFLNKFVALVAFQVCNCRCVTDTSFKRMLFSVRGKPSMWVDVRMGPRPMVRTTAVAFARSSTRRETVLLL